MAAFQIAVPLPLGGGHSTHHQVHPMGRRHMRRIFPQGHGANFTARRIPAGNIEQHPYHLFQIFPQLRRRNTGIDPFCPSDCLRRNLRHLRLSHGAAVVTVHFIDKVFQQHRPGIAKRQNIVSVENHHIGSLPSRPIPGRHQMNPHRSGTFRIQSGVAHAVSPGAQLRPFIGYAHGCPSFPPQLAECIYLLL